MLKNDILILHPALYNDRSEKCVKWIKEGTDEPV